MENQNLDFRSLCAELVEALETNDYYDEGSDEMPHSGLLKRARVALAETEPVQPTAVRTVQPSYAEGQRSREDVEMAVRAVCRCEPHELQPVGPTDSEIFEYWIETFPEYGSTDPVAWANAVLSRWGRRMNDNTKDAVFAKKMFKEDGSSIGWYIDHPEFYCDIEQEGGVWSVYFRHRETDQEVYSESCLVRPTKEKLPNPEHCCGNPRNGEGLWCWGREIPRTAAGTPVIWRLMPLESIPLEAVDWLPYWALPLPKLNNSRGSRG
jgi:hypothetical protein